MASAIFGEFDHEDLQRVRDIARNRSDSRLCEADRDDLAGEILLEAVVSASRTDHDLRTTAFAGVGRSSRYGRFVTQRLDRQDALLAMDGAAGELHQPSEVAVVDIRLSLDSLPPLEREYALRRAFLDEPLNDCAAQMSVSAATAYRIARRLRQQLSE